MKTPRIIVWVLIAYCVFVLVIGITRVDAVTPIPTCVTGPDRTAFGHGPSPQVIIDLLEQRGVDVTEVRAALQNGNTEAVKAWLEAYRQTHPEGNIRGPEKMNSEKVIDRLEQQGVDVTEVRTALQNGDTDAVKAWLEAHRQAHPEGMIHGSGEMNPEQVIERLEQKGVDVTEVKAAFQKGDTDAVKAWFRSYFGTLKDEMPQRHIKGPVQGENTR